MGYLTTMGCSTLVQGKTNISGGAEIEMEIANKLIILLLELKLL